MEEGVASIVVCLPSQIELIKGCCKMLVIKDEILYSTCLGEGICALGDFVVIELAYIDNILDRHSNPYNKAAQKSLKEVGKRICFMNNNQDESRNRFYNILGSTISFVLSPLVDCLESRGFLKGLYVCMEYAGIEYIRIHCQMKFTEGLLKEEKGEGHEVEV